MNFPFRTLFAFLLLCSSSSIYSQCTSTTDAGTMDEILSVVCPGTIFDLPYNQNAILDSDDILQFIVHDSPDGSSIGNIISTYNEPTITWVEGLDPSFGYSITAIAGNDDGTGNVDFNDPCFSFSSAAIAIFPLQLQTDCQDVFLDCLTSTVTLECLISLPENHQYTWVGPNGFSSIDQYPVISASSNVSGDYVVEIKDLTHGCITLDTVYVDINVMEVTTTISNISCDGNSDGSIDVNVTGGTPPYKYLWFNGTATSFITNLASGIYTVTVEDAIGCIQVETIVISDPLVIFCSQTGTDPLNCSNPIGTISLDCLGGVPPYTFLWSDGNTTSVLQTPAPGTYSITVTDANGCTFVEDYTVVEEDTECGVIKGTISLDENTNCQFDNNETLVSGLLVEAIGVNNYYGFSDENGEYIISAPPGQYTVSPILNEDLWSICTDDQVVTIASPEDVVTADFIIEKLLDCPLMTVEISTPFLRRCFSGGYSIYYCNEGTVDATDATIEVMMDELIEITSTSIPVTDLGDGIYEFEIGDVAVGSCDYIFIGYNVSCEAVLGQTFCTEARIFPDDSCIENQAEWSGASISIGATCEGNEINVNIENVGIGDMNEVVEYIVIEDGVMSMSIPGELQLNSGEVYTFSLPANGSTYRVEVDQVSFHPGNSMPSVTIEACGTNGSGSFSTGFVNQFSQDEGDEFISIDCQEVVGSFDPNDKQGFPEGYSAEHFIERGQGLEYLIRFQNTGTDTAFTVRIEDVLSSNLDLSTIRLGAASHAFELDIVGSDTLNFIFNNIMLPDSNINEAASHGFVQFSIDQKAGLELGTVIENTADIYFDFNEPVRTNTVFHTLGEMFVLTKTQELFIPNLSVNVAPNPFSDKTVIQLEGYSSENIKLKLYNLNGQLLMEKNFDEDYLTLQKGALSAGMYFYKIEVGGILGATGKLIAD